MKRNNLIKLVVSTMLLCTGINSANAKAKYEWTMQSSDQPGIFMFQMAQEYSTWVKDMTNGDIEISIAPVNSVVPYSEVLDSVGSGILQGEFDDPSYFAGKDEAFSFIGNTIGAFSYTSEAIKFIYYGGGLEVAQKLYDQYNVHLIGVVVTGVESLVCNREIRTVEELKGLKLRAPEGMVQRVFAAAGASPVNLPGSEVYSALAKGVIDASDFSLFSVNQSQGMNDIAKFPIQPGFHSVPIQAVTLNKDIWDKLPPNYQAILENGVRRLAMDVMYQYELQDFKAIKEAKAKGITVVDWSPEERAKFKKIAVDQWHFATDKSAIAKEYSEKLELFLKSQGLLQE